MIKKILFFLLTLFIFNSCNDGKKPAVSFYYWKTIFKLSSSKKEILKENKVSKLYIRYFDIDVNSNTNEAFPVAPIHFAEKPTPFSIVPVVYIKNNVMLNKSVDISELVTKTSDYIQQINTKNNITIQEIQIDCDWTLASKDRFLEFMELFKKSNNTLLSATIRLHQVKYYEKTKIPNVDKGVLMYYNMGKIGPNALNSIYDKNVSKNYLKSLKKYPLKLNVALPIFSWAVHTRNGGVIGLKNKINSADLQKDANFVQKGENYFQVVNNNYKNSTFYKKNDFLKLEAVSQDKLLEMAHDLHNNLAENPEEIIFYDLDDFNIQDYEKDIFTKISASF